MQTYFDHTELERSRMSEDEVKTFLDLHLMEKGVLKIAPLKLRALDAEPTLEKVALYEVEGMLFDTAEQAAAFLKLKPRRSNYEYALGYDYKYPHPIEGEIKAVALYNRQSLLDAKTVLAKNKSAKEANEKAEREYEEASKKMRSCLDEVWDDYYHCVNLSRQHQKVIDTETEYLKMTAGDTAMALSFLQKAYTAEEIEEAKKWFASTPVTE